MDNDDDSLCTPTPNDFLLSIYKENLSANMPQTKLDENLKILPYKCCLCRKIHDNPILICSTCVNAGQFCSSKQEICSNKRREILLSMLNKNDYDEFQQYSSDKWMDVQYSDRMFLLKKFNSEKNILRSEFQIKSKSSIETRQMSEEIQIRKNRLHFVNHSIQKLREQIEQKKQVNITTQQRINTTRSRVEIIKIELDQIKQISKLSKDETRKKFQYRIKQINKLHDMRRERFNELTTYLFPIQRVSAHEDGLATRIKALLIAQKQTNVDETNNEQLENEEVSISEDDRYQIVNSFLPRNGDYQIDSLISICNFDANTTQLDTNIYEPDSPQLSPSRESYSILSALSHACQLINVIAFYLHINLPFRLHQLQFNTENLTTDCLRADIAKLNANIVSTCLSQNIPIRFTNVTCTLENLFELLKCQRYPSRTRPISYSQKYIDMIENEVNEISRVYVTDYWFDDEENDEEKAIKDILNSYEWETIPHSSSPSTSGYQHSSPSNSGYQPSSMMNSSIDYLKTKSSGIINSLFG